MTRKIIAFAGRAQTGKSYRCGQLVKQGNYKQVAFADALRKILFVTLGIPYEKGMEQYEELKKTPLYNGQTLRQMLEHLGTEGIRHYDNDFWAKCLLKEIDEIPKDMNVCVSDLRFYNEYKYLKDYCTRNEYEFSLIFCDYHSEGYQEVNQHASARLANFLKEVGYEDGDEIRDNDMQVYIELMDALVK